MYKCSHKVKISIYLQMMMIYEHPPMLYLY